MIEDCPIFGSKNVGGSGGGGGGTSDHSKLSNRNLPDQHPIESITGLKNLVSKGVYLDDNCKEITVNWDLANK